MLQGVDDSERQHVVFRARGLVAYSPALLAEALGVHVDELLIKPDPQLYGLVEKERRRLADNRWRKSGDKAFFDAYHGRD